MLKINLHMWIESQPCKNAKCILWEKIDYSPEKIMNSVTSEIALIALIFVLGVTLCFQSSILVGIGFIIVANVALPTIIKFSQVSVTSYNKLQQR